VVLPNIKVVQILVKANFFWLARRECLITVIQQVHYRGLKRAAHHQSCKLSFHKNKNEKSDGYLLYNTIIHCRV